MASSDAHQSNDAQHQGTGPQGAAAAAFVERGHGSGSELCKDVSETKVQQQNNQLGVRDRETWLGLTNTLPDWNTGRETANQAPYFPFQPELHLGAHHRSEHGASNADVFEKRNAHHGE